ncbi:MAG: hypothetical protein K1X35_05215 [Caulobacteraceae bacterium]|nr:hypothetical protein [Caulobacteraceae bacterium]
MTVVRTIAAAGLIAAAASLAPMPGTPSSAAAATTRCSAYQPGARTPERRQLMENLVAAINRSPHAGTQYAVKRLWLSCDYARVQLRNKGGRNGRSDAPAVLDALMRKVNGEWTYDMFADPAGGPAGQQYLARHPDMPSALVYW